MHDTWFEAVVLPVTLWGNSVIDGDYRTPDSFPGFPPETVPCDDRARFRAERNLLQNPHVTFPPEIEGFGKDSQTPTLRPKP